MTEEEKLDLAIDWIRSQGWNEENLPSDEVVAWCEIPEYTEE